jgi:hypothetical protein
MKKHFLTLSLLSSTIALASPNGSYEQAMESLNGDFRLVAAATNAKDCPAHLKISAHIVESRLVFSIAQLEDRGGAPYTLASDKAGCDARAYGQTHLTRPSSQVKYGTISNTNAPYISYACNDGFTTGGDGYVGAMFERAGFKLAITASADGNGLALKEASTGFSFFSSTDTSGTKTYDHWNDKTACTYSRAQ